MKSLFSTLVLVIFLSINIYAQSNFKEGYFIDSENNKVECLIDLKFKMDDRSYITYKTSEDSSKQEIATDELKEFRIYGTGAYYRIFTLEENIFDENAVLIKRKGEEVFINVLVEGDATLYMLKEKSTNIYFFSKDDKLYVLRYSKKTKDGKVLDDRTFQKQLYDHLNCESFTIKKISDLKYNTNDLVGIFKEYADCNNSDAEDFFKNRTKTIVNIRATFGGIYTSSVDAEGIFKVFNSSVTDTESFGSNFSYSIGLDVEFTYNNDLDKWRIYLAPNYQKTNSSGEPQIRPGSFYTESMIEIPIGLRRYFTISNNTEVFLNAAYAFNVHIESEFSNGRFFFREVPLSSFQMYSVIFGIGTTFKKKYSVLINYYLVKQQGIEKNTYQINYNNAINFIFAYKLF